MLFPSISVRYSLLSASALGTLVQTQYEQRLWDAYMNGYQQIRSLDTQILEAIPWFVLVRHLWWMAIDLRKIQQELMGQSWLDSAWFDHHIQRFRQWMRLFCL